MILCFLFLSVLVFAHPPKEVALSYDPATKMLTITVTHLIKQSLVSDPAKHYVKEISVKINDKSVVVANYSSQQADEGDKVIFMLNLKSADKVTVRAVCSMAGDKTSELMVK